MNNKDSKSESPRIERRKFLQTASTAAVGTLTIPEVVEASPNVGSVHYCELGYEYGVDHNLDNGVTVSETITDETVGHTFMEQDKQLVLLEPVADSVPTFVRNSTVVRSLARYQTFNSVAGSPPQSRLAPIVLGKHFRTLRSVRLVEELSFPDVMIQSSGPTAVVRVDNAVSRIPSGGEATISLPKVEVMAQTVEFTDELVDDPTVPRGKRAMKTIRDSALISLTPTVKVANYGEVEVLDATDKRVVHKAR